MESSILMKSLGVGHISQTISTPRNKLASGDKRPEAKTQTAVLIHTDAKYLKQKSIPLLPGASCACIQLSFGCLASRLYSIQPPRLNSV